jgi:hypothetical protein
LLEQALRFEVTVAVVDPSWRHGKADADTILVAGYEVTQ